MHALNGKNILLAVTGSIAAYKSAEIIRLLRQNHANVQVIMTKDAQEFMTPLTLQALSGNPIHCKLLDHDSEASMSHITLARWADVLLVAPASANILAKFSHGIADDLLSTLYLATTSPVIIAPAMNQHMWHHPATQHNKNVLSERNVLFLGPGNGSQACGDYGPGRMLEPEDIVLQLNHFFSPKPLAGLTVVITAGPTQESIDPVRYISNHSSGKMGYALALAAHLAGAKVVLISGPTCLTPPLKVKTIQVKTAQEMHETVMQTISQADIFVAAAAVADFRCEESATQKIKKDDLPDQLTLIKNPDILKTVSKLPKRPFMVGFAAETDQVLANAKLKFKDKNLDIIIANQVGVPHSGFNNDVNEVTVITQKNEIAFPARCKKQLAMELFTLIANEYLHHMTTTKEVDKVTV